MQTVGAIIKPNPIRWLGYAFGAGLPAANREWVLYDTTTGTWVLRHFVRATVQLAPFVVALYVLIPGEPWVRAVADLAGVLLGFFYSAAYLYEAVEHRATKAGYPRGFASATRAVPKAGANRERDERYAARWRGVELPS